MLYCSRCHRGFAEEDDENAGHLCSDCTCRGEGTKTKLLKLTFDCPLCKEHSTVPYVTTKLYIPYMASSKDAVARIDVTCPVCKKDVQLMIEE